MSDTLPITALKALTGEARKNIAKRNKPKEKVLEAKKQLDLCFLADYTAVITRQAQERLALIQNYTNELSQSIFSKITEEVELEVETGLQHRAKAGDTSLSLHREYEIPCCCKGKTDSR